MVAGFVVGVAVDVLFYLVDETVVVEQKVAQHLNLLVTFKNELCFKENLKSF